ncbi:zinc finger protein 568-like isoform X2 [Armigeres subalbatus]
MGRKCCVPKCSSNYDAVLRQGQSTISTFKFPEDKRLRDRWISALNRDDKWQPGSTASICINHFLPEDILRYDKPAKLKPEAIPAIFSEHARKGPTIKRGRPKRIISQRTPPKHSEDDETALHDELIGPSDDLTEGLILGFENFSRLLPEKIPADEWHYHRRENVLHFYSILEEDPDTAIIIDNSFKIYDNMKVKLFLKQAKQTEESLKWILDNDMKLHKWSQFETLLQKYDSKVTRVKDNIEKNQNEHQSEIGSSVEPELDSKSSDENEEFLDQYEDGEVEFLEVEEQLEVNTFEEPVHNPLKIAQDQSQMIHSNAERRTVRETVQRLKSSKHKCFICNQEHDTNENFEQHLTKHSDMLPFRCDRCELQTVTIKTLASLNKHLLMHQKPLKCRTCDVRFSSYGTRLLHEQNSHENSRPTTCEVCGKVSRSLRGHQHHFKIHTDPESMKCQLCGKQLTSSYELKLHMRVHTREKPNKCPFCAASFNRISNLVVHKRRLHSTEKPFQCTICKERLTTNTEMKRHLAIHNSELSISAEETLIPRTDVGVQSNDTKKDYHCKSCDKLLPSASVYHSHMRKHRKRYQCSFCGLRIGQLKDFIDHENTHTGRRPYKCEICSKTFKTSSTYYGHRVIHEAERRFSCDLCGRRFNRLRHLNVHMRTHKQGHRNKAQTVDSLSSSTPERQPAPQVTVPMITVAVATPVPQQHYSVFKLITRRENEAISPYTDSII